MVTAADRPAAVGESSTTSAAGSPPAAPRSSCSTSARGGRRRSPRLAAATGGPSSGPPVGRGPAAALEAAVGPIRIALSHQYYVRSGHGRAAHRDRGRPAGGTRPRARLGDAAVGEPGRSAALGGPAAARCHRRPPPLVGRRADRCSACCWSHPAWRTGCRCWWRPAGIRAGSACRRAGPATRRRQDLFFVFLLPCLNEDGSCSAASSGCCPSPATTPRSWSSTTTPTTTPPRSCPQVVGDRVWLLRRKAPDARQGKGEALNAAVRALVRTAGSPGCDPDRVIVVIVDADGRLEPTALRGGGAVLRRPQRWPACRPASGSTTGTSTCWPGCRTWSSSSSPRSSSAAAGTWTAWAWAATGSSCGCPRCSTSARRRGRAA